MFTLTDTTQIACYGTSFKSLADAKNCAISLQESGLCKSYSIGKYTEEGHVEVYNSNKEYTHELF
jgi:hypothetical protein